MVDLNISKNPALAGPRYLKTDLKISVVAPMLNEEGGAIQLVQEIAAALCSIPHEIIIVDDGSTDDTPVLLRNLRTTIPQLRLIRHQNNAGQSRALRTGVLAAQAPIIAMLDGDGQNDPADLPTLIAALSDENAQAEMISGERRKRQDSRAKRWASNFANGLRRRLLDDGAFDTGCGLKVFHRDAFLRLPYFDHMHRYLPALMRREGYQVRFVPVAHRARTHGASKYSNFGRLMVAIRDLLGVLWLKSRSRQPGNITEVSD